MCEGGVLPAPVRSNQRCPSRWGPFAHAALGVVTAVHQYGDVLVGRVRVDQVHVDRVDSIFRIHLRNEKSSEGTDQEEKEANLFAAELLMPKQFVDRDLKAVKVLDEDSLQLLAHRYDVSVQAMTFRLAYLGYFPLPVEDGLH